LETLPLSTHLKAGLCQLDELSRYVASLLGGKAATSISEQIALLKRTYALRYEFLCPLVPSKSFDSLDSLDPLSLLEEPESRCVLEDGLRISALLYMQATLQEFPLAAVGSLYLVQRLREKVMQIRVNNLKEGELVLWCLVVGGLEARGGDRVWFGDQLGRLGRKLKIVSWEDGKKALEGLWWIGRVHDVRGRTLWEDSLCPLTTLSWLDFNE